MRDELPWEDTDKWKRGWWYPLPSGGDVEFNGVEMTVESSLWDLFRLDPDKDNGDMEPMGIDTDFYSAVKVANAINPEQLWTASWIKDKSQRRALVGGTA